MLKVRVRSVTYEAEGILSYELIDAAGGQLPRFEAGAHIDVRVPGGLSRRYSLCDPPAAAADHYRIAVLNVPKGRGGSKAMHENVQAGDIIEISEPHNFFPLDRNGSHAILLAGGIGITPLLAMMEELLREDKSFELHYCARTAEHTAFGRRLAPHVARGLVHVHHDGGNPDNGLDITALLRERRDGAHVYYCGPAGFMTATSAATVHWPREAVHFEYFGAEAATASPAVVNGATLAVELKHSGRTISVGASQTILQALREAGIECESSCESGVCGTCKLGYSGGKPEHNDYILTEEERTNQVLICCARVAESPLVLDK